jgi:hypothetical protein
MRTARGTYSGRQPARSGEIEVPDVTCAGELEVRDLSFDVSDGVPIEISDGIPFLDDVDFELDLD